MPFQFTFDMNIDPNLIKVEIPDEDYIMDKKPVVKKVKIQAQLNFTKIDKSSAFKQMNADLKKLTDKAKQTRSLRCKPRNQTRGN